MDELDKAAEKDLDERIFSEDIGKDVDPDWLVPDLEEASDKEEDEVYGAAAKPPQTTVRVTPGTPGTPGISTGGFTTPKGPFLMPVVPPAPSHGKKRLRTKSELTLITKKFTCRNSF